MKRFFISLGIFLVCYSIGAWISGSFVSGWFSGIVAITIDGFINDSKCKNKCEKTCTIKKD